MEQKRGTGEVHSHLGMGPGGGGVDEEPAGGWMPGEGPERGGSRPRDEARARAEELLSQARHRGGSLLRRAGDALEERTGLVSLARENPLAAMGVAFAVGYLLAGSGESGRGLGRTRQQLRGAILGGLGAAIAEEARGFLEGAAGRRGGGADEAYDEEDELEEYEEYEDEFDEDEA